MLTITERVVQRARDAYGVTILDHEDWGSVHRGLYEWRRQNKPVSVLEADTLVQHITVTFDMGELIGHFKTDMRTVERIGFERFGSGTSYNFVFDMQTGMCGVGMPLDAKGTHTQNDKNVPGFSTDQNLVARAFAVLGICSDPLSKAAKRAMAGVMAAMMDEGALTEDPDYVPHSFFAFKDCPCNATRNAMAEIFQMAKDLRNVPEQTIKIAHASLQFSDSEDQKRHDIETVFNFKAHVLTGTEASQPDMIKLLKEQAKKDGYWFKRGGDTWVAIRKDFMPWWSIRSGYVHVIDGVSKQYSNKGVTWMGGRAKGLGRIDFGAVHLLTKGRRPGDPRYQLNEKYVAAINQWASHHGRGDRLAFVNGDVNRNDRVMNVFTDNTLLTCWDEKDVYPDTHGADNGSTIDLIARLRRDGRVSCKRAWVYHKTPIHSDHHPVLALYNIKEK